MKKLIDFIYRHVMRSSFLGKAIIGDFTVEQLYELKELASEAIKEIDTSGGG